MELVEDGIPSGMELFDTIVARQREVVATTVTRGEVGVDSGQRVKRLMDISKIVDQKAKRIRTTTSIIVIVIVHDGLVDWRILVAGLVHQPVNDSWDCSCDVHHIFLEIRVVFSVSALIKVRDINEVPVRLPATALILDHVSKRCSLHKGMIALGACNSLVCHVCENLLSLLQGHWVFLFKDVIAHTCNYTIFEKHVYIKQSNSCSGNFRSLVFRAHSNYFLLYLPKRCPWYFQD